MEDKLSHPPPPPPQILPHLCIVFLRNGCNTVHNACHIWTRGSVPFHELCIVLTLFYLRKCIVFRLRLEFYRISKISSDWIFADLENLVRLDCPGSRTCRSNRVSRFSKISPDWIVLVLDNLVGLGCPGSRKSRPTGLSRFSTLPSDIRYFEFVFRQ
jgi:hypothetical protein